MEIQVLKEQSIFDIAIEATHIADNAFEIAYANSKSISEFVEIASVLNIPSVFSVYSFPVNNQELPEALPAFYNKTIESAACFFDVAVISSGTIENAFDLAYLNHKSISEVLQTAALVKIPSKLPAYISSITRTEPVEVQETFYNKTLEHAACFFDLIPEALVTVENAFDLAYLNHKSISEVLEAAAIINIPAKFHVYVSSVTNAEPRESQEALYKFTVPRDACFFDFALDYTGNNENAFSMAYINNKSISDILLKDDIVIISGKLDRNLSIVNYFKKNGINASSGIIKTTEIFRIFDDTFDNTYN